MSFKNKLFSFFFISILGVLLHFTYEYSGNNPIVALFSAVNESTWEHLKLLFFPFLLLTIIETLIMPDTLPENFLSSRTIGIVSGMLFIIISFYTFIGVIGKSYDFINIGIYFVAVIISLITENKLFTKTYNNSSVTAAIILFIITVAFFVFTFNPPDIGLFINPLNHT